MDLGLLLLGFGAYGIGFRGLGHRVVDLGVKM